MTPGHSHSFGQEKTRAGEQRTVIVIAITAVMMAVEIGAGIAFGSMALLADGLHMASHTAALGLAAFAYVYARRHAGDDRYSFGTGKVNALAGFTGAIILAGFAVIMLIESAERFLNPVAIVFNQAIYVAGAGFVINVVSIVILGGHHEKEGHDHGHEDHNLRSAYLHVLADALTSVLAIMALLAGKYMGAVWMDPVMGVLGAGLVIRWSWGLLRQSGRVLLDRQAPGEIRDAIVDAVEQQEGNRIYDLHVWAIGPGYYAAEIALETPQPKSPEYYRRLLPDDLGLAHVTVEVSVASRPEQDGDAIVGGPLGAG
jgi:cation diffusion facilitator family transporter